jgi:hypothetical protein
VDHVSASLRSRRAWVILSAVAAGVLVLLTVLSMSRAAEPARACRGSLIPAYVTPAALTGVLDAPQVPRVLIINPASGPGTEPHPPYREAVEAAHAKGARVLGYVPTGYGAREAAAAEADIDRYRSWYGVDGIFLDEAAHDPAQLPYYRALSRHARAGGGKALVVLNPGRVPARGYFDVADVVVTFEGVAADYAAALQHTPAWVRDLPLDRIAHLLYGASREQALAAVNAPATAGWLYVTSGTLPNPWETLPDFLNEQEAALKRCS